MKRIIFLIIGIIVPFISNASHVAGGHMEYECLGGGQYKVRLVFFRDCNGLIVTENSGPDLRLESQSCGQICINLGQMDYVSNENVDYGCGNTCQSGSLPGFEKWVFEKIITLPVECSDWKASIVISARNSTTFAGGGTYFNYVLINNENGVCNNSPTFNDMSVWLGCQNTQTQFDNLFSESEGDLVQFEITNPQNQSQFGALCTSDDLTFQAGLTFTQPFPATGPFVVDQNTGVMQFTPTQQGTSYFALKVSEYRSGVLVSETIRDGEIIVSACTPSSSINPLFWMGTTSYVLTVEPSEDSCFIFPIISSSPILDVSLSGLSPTNFNVGYSGLGTNTVAVNICPKWDSFGGFCDPISNSFNVTVSSQIDGCFNASGSVTQGYSLLIDSIEFCPEYRYFTNRNSVSGLGMPVFAKASNTIWVGDSMPPSSPIPPSQWGTVVYSGDVTLQAGVEIIIPSCIGGSGVLDCVILNGNSQTLITKPFNCSPDCEQIPLEIEVIEVFDCGNESVVVNIFSGTPPYTISWTDENGINLGTANILNVHDYVSTHLWDDGLIYNLYVEDAAGFTANFSDEVHGTARFYEPLFNNMYPFPEADFEINKWYCYPDAQIDTNAVYLYDGNFGIYINYPTVLWDGINTTPPWYGATYMEYRVFDSNGQVLHEKTVDLENSDDWSMDNYEFYWDGTLNNTGDPNDCLNSPLDIFNYTLLAENCQTIPHCETGMIVHFACYEGDWNDSIWVAKGPEGSNYGGIIFDKGRTNYTLDSLGTISGEIELYPNPSNDMIYVNGKGLKVSKIEILDATGKVVITTSNLVIDVNALSSGTYLVKISTSEGVETRKLVVNQL